MQYMNNSEQKEIQELLYSSVTTEFSRPLDLIALNCEYLSAHLEARHEKYDEEKVWASLDDIRNAAAYLERLTENYAEMASCLHGTAKPRQEAVELVSLLRAVCGDSEEIYRMIGVTLELGLENGEECLVRADRTYVERILLNLLSNSLRACTRGGHVRFTLSKGVHSHTLTIRDDGCGMDPQLALTAFDPLRPLLQKPGTMGAGAGVGLYLCGEYCRLMDWKIHLRPQEKGTCVTLDIPALQGAPAGFQFRSSDAEETLVLQQTRRLTLRELRLVPGLARLKRTEK